MWWNDIEMNWNIFIYEYIYILPSSTDHGRYLLVVILFGLFGWCEIWWIMRMVDRIVCGWEWFTVVEKYPFVVENKIRIGCGNERKHARLRAN